MNKSCVPILSKKKQTLSQWLLTRQRIHKAYVARERRVFALGTSKLCPCFVFFFACFFLQMKWFCLLHIHNFQNAVGQFAVWVWSDLNGSQPLQVLPVDWGELLPQVKKFKYLGVCRFCVASVANWVLYCTAVDKLSWKTKLSIYRVIYIQLWFWTWGSYWKNKIQTVKMYFLHRVAGLNTDWEGLTSGEKPV